MEVDLNNLNFDGVEDYAPPPEGIYNLIVDQVEIGTSSKGNPQLAFTYKIMDEPFYSKGFQVRDWVSLTEASRWKLKQVLEAITKVDWDQPGMQLDPNSLVGLTFKGLLYHQPFQDKNGKTRIGAQISEYMRSDSNDVGFPMNLPIESQEPAEQQQGGNGDSFSQEFQQQPQTAQPQQVQQPAQQATPQQTTPQRSNKPF